MRLSADVTAFAARLGHVFARPELLLRALTHGSMSSPNRDDNQRLEFLGDRVLGLVMAEALLQADPGASEGQVAPHRQMGKQQIVLEQDADAAPFGRQ